jgi:predicted outer membrane protein
MRRLTTWTIGCATAVSVVIAACDGSDDRTASVATQSAGGGDSSGSLMQQLTVDELAQLLLDGNADQVGDGGLGMARGQDAAVVGFAQQLVADHTAAIAHARATAATAGIVPQLSPADQMMAQQWALEQQQLRLVPLAQFDVAFMCREVRQHVLEIATIDGQGAAALQGPLAADLQLNRATAQLHLERALQILGALSSGQVSDQATASAYCQQLGR